MSYNVSIAAIDSFNDWRLKARIAISHNLPPHLISWNGGSDLFAGQPLPSEIGKREVSVPKPFLDLAKSVIWHSDPQRFSMLYLALWRLVEKQGQPLSTIDVLGAKLHQMAKSVRRDIHKMHAFVRFQEIKSDGQRRRFIAWFEPEHFITEPASRFFAKRFADMDWMIATPSICASFDGESIKLTEYDGKPLLPGDDVETLWGTYFANIFNPARIKLNAMRSEMPMKYWKNMPETQLIPQMLLDAEERVRKMQEAAPQHPRVGAARVSQRYRQNLPQSIEQPSNLEELATALQKCRRCNLCEMATRAVPGQGSASAKLLLVGEQPGDREDLEGKPFVGPAGQLLQAAVSKLELSSNDLWLTNAVKHFKFKISGKRRIHESPNRGEIDHCRWWLQHEIDLVQPRVILSLGASASYSLTGKVRKQSERRGKMERLENGVFLVHSWHPSFALRAPDADQRARIMEELTADLQTAMLEAS